MKLNKVMALALSGLMAVSMLAGCAGNPDGGDNQGDVNVNPGVSSAVDVMNNMQSKVEFKADPILDAALASGVEGIESAVLNRTTNNVAVISSGDVYNGVRDKLDGGYKLQPDEITAFDSNADAKKDTTATVLYWVKAGNLTEENVLTLVANDMATSGYSDATDKIDGKYYSVDYTGAVSIVKASATPEKGDTVNVYVVAVSVTQTIGNEIKW